ncbi:MAG TPA: LysR substrate-binding domain-containing protein [Beijerinckiaceae bacterium]|jgi:DNA-binding transcriptional LysR family regulator|nr:LysR substrate-binding domain-containing protein [Beijerinckiaceae bacterium]
MNLHLLRIFKEVAERGSFTQAAEALRISQPAVSKGVRELEAQLGSPLLERGAGGVRPTAIGLTVLAHARPLFAAEKATEEMLRAISGLEAGSLAIGASTTVAIYFLPLYVGRFHQKHPHVAIELHSANTRDIAQLLKQREIDIAIVEGPVSDPEFVVTPWQSDELIAVVGRGHKLASTTRPLAVSELESEFLVLREMGSGTREVVMNALTAAGISPQRTMTVNSTEAVKRLVASGVGMAIVSAAAAQDLLRLRQLKQIRFQGFEVQRFLNRLTIKHRQETAAARAFNRLIERSADGA